MTKWDANLYSEKHSFVWEKARDLLELLSPQTGDRILDLGCGTGQLTSEIAATGAYVLGVDRSPEMIAEARSRFPALQFEVCDARQLRFRDDFTAVFSNAVLHWVPQAEEVIGGITRALKPGGRFVAEFGGKGNVKNVVAALDTALGQFGSPAEGVNPWYYPSIADYSVLLEKHGLEESTALLFDRPTKLEDGERGLSTWLTMFCDSYLSRVASDKRGDFLLAVERLARPILWKSGHWELDYRRLRIVARKPVA